jgi:hypothetical protein
VQDFIQASKTTVGSSLTFGAVAAGGSLFFFAIMEKSSQTKIGLCGYGITTNNQVVKKQTDTQPEPLTLRQMESVLWENKKSGKMTRLDHRRKIRH